MYACADSLGCTPGGDAHGESKTNGTYEPERQGSVRSELTSIPRVSKMLGLSKSERARKIRRPQED